MNTIIKANKLYFKSAKSKYERYINKKWAERKDLFESKQTFITRAPASWERSSDVEQESFWNASATAANKMRIKNFFCSNKTLKSSADISPPSPVTASVSNDKPLQTDLCENPRNASYIRGEFLQSKESFSLKNFLCDIKYSGSNIFQDSVLNDTNFMSTVTKLSYGWENLSELRRKYNSGNIFVKNSKLKGKIDMENKKSGRFVI